MQAEWSHHCSACGKCCNSPPQLSVPELLHHQHTFFGCLTIQRMARPSLRDAALHSEQERLAASLWHRLPEGDARTDDVLLATGAFDLGISPRCPALDDEQRCSLHADRKPAICRVVPLDALQADRAQHLVLASRESEAHYFGSDCIAPGQKPAFEVVTRRFNVVQDGARAALAQRRRDLAEERSAWGDRVFQLLRADLFRSPAALERLPRAGFMTLSLAPVLIALLEKSQLSRSRCVEYLDAQARLAQRLLDHAGASGHAERDTVRQLAAFAGTNTRLRSQLKDD
jgi:Fe-S-cluster containining protein